MPNPSYVKGREFEYTVKRMLEKLGFYVVRAYGSAGTFDLVAVPPQTGKEMFPMLIQCKSIKRKHWLHPEEKAVLLAAKQKWYGLVVNIYKADGRIHVATPGEKGPSLRTS